MAPLSYPHIKFILFMFSVYNPNAQMQGIVAPTVTQTEFATLAACQQAARLAMTYHGDRIQIYGTCIPVDVK